MTNEQWMQSLRKRAHDASNTLQIHEARIVRIEERQIELTRKAAQIDRLSASVAELRHQATILKWAVGCMSAVAVGCLVKIMP